MANIAGIKKRINKKIWRFRKRMNYLSPKAKRCRESGISIISCNCIGGVVLSELNMVFNTPTINEYMSAGDFLLFCESIEHYLLSDLTPAPASIQECYQYPVAILGDDIYIHAVHYKTFEEFKEKWHERCLRVNMRKLFFIFTDRDGFTEDLLDRISKIPYKKVLFANKEYMKYDFVCKVPGFEKELSVGDLCSFKGISGKRLYSCYNFKNAFVQMEESSIALMHQKGRSESSHTER